VADIPKKPDNSVSNIALLETVPFIKGGPQHHVITLNGREYLGMDGKSIHNALLLTERDEKTKGFIVFDVFQHEIYFISCPPWEDEETFFPHPIRECDLMNYRAWLETRGIKITKQDADDILLSIAQRNPKNPPREWLETLIYDGSPRLDNWLINACDAQDDPKYLKIIGPKWFIAGVKRIYEPGCKFDSALIFEGQQGWEKSKAFEVISTINGKKYFLDEAIRVGDKDGLMKLQGKVVFEMSELATLQRGGETEEMKAFMSRREDVYREPYRRKVITRPRMFIIGGTINPTGGYLTDPTGARRYWPVECGSHLATEWLELNKEQLWAEAVYRYKQGERIWLLEDEMLIAEKSQRKRFKQPVLTDDIETSLKAVEIDAMANNRQYFSINEIMVKMGIDRTEKKTSLINNQVREYLVFHGYVTCRPRVVDTGKITRPERWIKAIYKKELEGKENNEEIS
jgi:predicted P-loop ATPase